ncbi:N-acetyltransferase [Clostridium sp.]|uniref:N-acetyltransferase n=1 Tax=Clostridium sp. TaxID=1506 RepID=UPI003463A5DF
MNIRAFNIEDIEEVVDIWLNSNIAAHNFIHEDYWNSNYELVKTQYIPNSETYIYEEEGKVKGFLSIMKGEFIGAVFVNVNYQSKGIGKALINYAKERYNKLSLTVYEENIRAVEFYEREGFNIILSQIDEATGKNELMMKWKMDS